MREDKLKFRKRNLGNSSGITFVLEKKSDAVKMNCGNE